jgi:signal transduction histidine kinase
MISALLVVLPTIGGVVFLRLYLRETGAQFASDFERQNSSALASADTLALASRLNDLSVGEHWACLKAFVDEVNFLTRGKSDECSSRLFRIETVVNSPSTQERKIRIIFVMELPIQLQAALLAMILGQILAAALSVRAIRRADQQENQARLALAELASQVAHDIRSPLAALQVAEMEFDGLSPEVRELVRLATGRIREIANDLLGERRRHHTERQTGCIDLVSIIQALIREKSLEIRHHPGIHIRLEVETGLGSISSQVPEALFKRMLSNLINNSVEAIENSGAISVQLFKPARDRHLCQLVISDNGKGIPAATLLKIESADGSYGKVNGNGLGLSQARKLLKEWGGRLEISSTPAVGTEVRLHLPLSE